MADMNREFVDSREADYAGYENYLDALQQQMTDQLDQEEEDRDFEEPSEVGFDHIDEFDNFWRESTYDEELASYYDDMDNTFDLYDGE